MTNCFESMAQVGLIPRIIRELFQRLEHSGGSGNGLRCSYIEVYNEMVKDLLSPIDNPNSSLHISGGGGGGQLNIDATEIPVHTVEGALALMAQGNAFRKVSATRSNEHSSRSHALFLVSVGQATLYVISALSTTSCDCLFVSDLLLYYFVSITIE